MTYGWDKYLKNGYQLLICKPEKLKISEDPILLYPSKGSIYDKPKYMSPEGIEYFNKIKNYVPKFIAYIDSYFPVNPDESIFRELKDKGYFSLWKSDAPLEFLNWQKGYLVIFKVCLLEISEGDIKRINDYIISRHWRNTLPLPNEEYPILESVLPISDLEEMKREIALIVKSKPIKVIQDSEIVAIDKRSSFVDEEDRNYQEDVEKSEPAHTPDGPQPKPQRIDTLSGRRWKTNPKIGKEAIVKANYECEICSDHKTFISKKTEKNFMEVHHLIPMKQQDNFENSLDVPDNIFSLCPNCHRFLHYGRLSDKEKTLEQLFEKRRKFLEKQRGINKVTIVQLKRCYGIY